MKPSLSAAWPALLLLLLALTVRVWGLSFGLPMVEARPDEMTIAFQAMKFGTGDLNPHSFNYPSLFKYVVFAMFGGYYVVGKLLGHFQGQEDFLREFFTEAGTFRLLMRAWSAAAGVAGVGLLLRGPGGRWAALFLALCVLHVRDSHFGVTDITMTTLVTAGALLTQRAAWEGRPRDLLLAGLVCGLAVSVKYNAAVLGLPVLLAAAHAPRRLSAAALGVGAMGLGFLAGTPFALLDLSTFVRDFRFEMSHLSEGHHIDVGLGWVHHLTDSLWIGAGPGLMVVGALGGLLWWREQRGRAWVLLSFPVVYYALIGRGETAFFRYILPVLPFLCMFAGLVCQELYRRKPRAALLLAGLILLPNAYRTAQVLRLFSAGDTRADVGAWIEANVPSGAVILHAGAYTGAPMLQRDVANQTREAAARQGRADSAGFRKPDDMRWYDTSRPMYDVLFVKKEGIDFASQQTVAEILAAPPPWLLIESYPLTHYAAVPVEIETLAMERYTLAYEAWAWHPGQLAPPGLFDQQDAFYMPLGNAAGFTRMGPTLHLYRRID